MDTSVKLWQVEPKEWGSSNLVDPFVSPTFEGRNGRTVFSRGDGRD